MPSSSFPPAPTPRTYTLSLHDALPISANRLLIDLHFIQMQRRHSSYPNTSLARGATAFPDAGQTDRKSTRLNSSHVAISYAVFCLKKKPTVSDEQGTTLSFDASTVGPK